MKRPIAAVPLSLLLLAALGGCGSRDAGAPRASPGAPASAKTTLLDKGAELLQSRPPIDALNTYLDGFHFYNGALQRQMEAHHYCSVLDEELLQCVIFDAGGAGARLMGVEYVISARLFRSLPAPEKALWHSHVHEVKSGQLIAPGLPAPAEQALMEKIVGTYGKTWHTWHTDRYPALPLGVPQLMMGFTADGQTDPAMVAARDRRLGVSSADRRRARAELPTPPIEAGADAWQAGRRIQLADPLAPPAAAPPAAAAGR